MKRAMSVWLPRLASDLVRRKDRRLSARRDDRAILLVLQDHQKQVVGACCRRAAASGISPGMPLGEARAVLHAVRVEPFLPERIRAALRALAAWSSRFSPLVAVDDDGLLIDVSGCERVFGGEERLLMMAAKEYGELGFESRAAIAPTFACAWAVARFGGQTIVAEGDVRSAIESLPLCALRIDAPAVQALEEVGIERIGQVMDLPRSLLPARFGDELLFRLDQAMGRALEIIQPVRPSPPPVIVQEFDGPTTQWEAITGCTRMLIEELSTLLHERNSGARRIEIMLKRSDLPPAALVLILSHPCRDVKHLWSLVYPRLERVNLGTGVEAIRVAAPHVGPMPHEQVEHWNERDHVHEREFAGLLDTLTNRMGADRVLHAAIIESHIPERAFALRSGADAEATAQVRSADRPTLLFETPFPAEVISLAPDGPVMTVRWRMGERRITATVGPERIGAEWWRRHEPTRDYFKVQDAEGRWMWVYREVETARWFVHGVWA